MQTISARFFASVPKLLLRKGAVIILPFKFFATKIKYLTPLLALAVYLTNPTVVAADFLKVTTPADVWISTPFEINLDIAAQADTEYFLKARIGSDSSDLRDGQTLNEDNGVWLSDSVSWTSFPHFSTDQNGHWVGKLKAQASDKTKLGANFLVIRIHSASGTSIDSASYSINVLAQQKVDPPQPVVQVGEPILNEFVPQPQTGGNEWVEIKNKGDGPIDLSGWKVDDQEGGSSPQTIDNGIKVPAGGFFVVTFQNPKLNDLTDSVRLLKPDNSVVESYTYNQTIRGQSWSKDSSGNWFLTDHTTPNAENYVPVVSTTSTNTQPAKTVSNQTNSSQTENSLTNTENKLPQVLATSSAKIATVSASFEKNKSNTVALPLIILGILSLVGAGGFLIKKKMKSGRPIADQPL